MPIDLFDWRIRSVQPAVGADAEMDQDRAAMKIEVLGYLTATRRNIRNVVKCVEGRPAEYEQRQQARVTVDVGDDPNGDSVRIDRFVEQLRPLGILL